MNCINKNPCFLEDIIDAEYLFWPKTTGYNRESDLLLLLTNMAGQVVTVLVECKYFSGKSNAVRDEDDESRGDQLAEQFYDLTHNKLRLTGDLLLQVSNSNKYLFYVTKHYQFPTNEIEETFQKLDNLNCSNMIIKENMYWLSWRNLPEVISDVLRTHHLCSGNIKMLRDLWELFQKKRLVSFKAFQELKLPQHLVSRSDIPFFWQDDKRFFDFKLPEVNNIGSFFWRGR